MLSALSQKTLGDVSESGDEDDEGHDDVTVTHTDTDADTDDGALTPSPPPHTALYTVVCCRRSLHGKRLKTIGCAVWPPSQSV